MTRRKRGRRGGRQLPGEGSMRLGHLGLSMMAAPFASDSPSSGGSGKRFWVTTMGQTPRTGSSRVKTLAGDPERGPSAGEVISEVD